jgi:hypothetical protein
MYAASHVMITWEGTQESDRMHGSCFRLIECPRHQVGPSKPAGIWWARKPDSGMNFVSLTESIVSEQPPPPFAMYGLWENASSYLGRAWARGTNLC